MKFLRHLRVAKTLLMTDLKAFVPIMFGKVIDMFIWVSLSLWVSAYLLPKMGIRADYGLFMLGSMVAAIGIFEAWPTIFSLIYDFEQAKVTHYYATLPMPTWMVFGRLIVYNALVCGFLSALVIPLALPMLWGMFSLVEVNWLQFGAIFMVANCFFGAFAPFIACWIKSSAQIEHMWMRVIFPMWFLGGFQFSWDSLHATAPYFAYVNLLNPVLHATECYRIALTGIGSLPFWASFSYLAALTVLISCIAIVRLKRRLDFI